MIRVMNCDQFAFPKEQAAVYGICFSFHVDAAVNVFSAIKYFLFFFVDRKQSIEDLLVEHNLLLSFSMGKGEMSIIL